MKKALTVIGYIYVLSAMCMGSYYNWQYAQENGFVQWMLFGEVVPSLKGALWPYFVFRDSRAAQEREAVHKLKPLLDEASAVGELGKKWKDTPIKDVPQDAFETGQRLRQKFVKEGAEIDIEVLNRIYPELGTMFSQKLLRSMMVAEDATNLAMERRTVDSDILLAFGNAHELEVEWANWVNPRLKDLNAIFRQRW